MEEKKIKPSSPNTHLENRHVFFSAVFHVVAVIQKGKFLYIVYCTYVPSRSTHPLARHFFLLLVHRRQLIHLIILLHVSFYLYNIITYVYRSNYLRRKKRPLDGKYLRDVPTHTLLPPSLSLSLSYNFSNIHQYFSRWAKVKVGTHKSTRILRQTPLVDISIFHPAEKRCFPRS